MFAHRKRRPLTIETKTKYMEPITFLTIFATCMICSFIGGYLLGNIKATCEAEQTRRWWMNRQIKRERR